MPIFRVISLRAHAVCDALIVATTVLVPWIFGFAGLNLPSLFVWGIAGVGLILNLASEYPLGVTPLLPMRVHSLLEYTAVPVFLIVPVALFDDVSGLPVAIPVLGALTMLVNALTDYPPEPVAIVMRGARIDAAAQRRNSATSSTCGDQRNWSTGISCSSR